MGKLFEQYSVIYKDSNEFVEIGTNEDSGIGNVLIDFIDLGWDENMQIDSDLTRQLFSRLAKGSHRDSNSIFNAEESYLLEKIAKSFGEVYSEYRTKKIKKNTSGCCNLLNGLWFKFSSEMLMRRMNETLTHNSRLA